MAGQTITKLDPAFETNTAKVRRSLDAWRQQRKPREPIPESLWRAMVRLARAYRASPVAQALRVNYTALKRRLLGQVVENSRRQRSKAISQ
jgi:hypothetical protein